MIEDMKLIYLAIPLACLFAAVIAGLFGRQIGRAGAHTITIAGVAVAFAMSVYVYFDVMAGNTFNGTVYIWGVSDNFPFEVGFLIDSLTVTIHLFDADTGDVKQLLAVVLWLGSRRSDLLSADWLLVDP